MTSQEQAVSRHIAVRDAMIPVSSGQTFFDAMRAVGINSFELGLDPNCGLLYITNDEGETPFSVADEASTALFKARIEREGAGVCAVLLGTDFSGPDAEAHIQWAVRATRAAHELGAPAVRLDPLTANRELSMPQIRDNFVRSVEQVLAQTEETGISFGIENHGAVGNDPEFLDGVFERVGNPRLGMTLDIGNFYWSGFPLSELYGVIEHFAPRARHTHMKSIAYPAEMRDTRRETGYEYGRYCAPLDQGDIDMARVVSALRSAGYAGALCVENEALSKFAAEERSDVVRREVELLRAVDSQIQSQ
ncbi:MAG: L-ribulose-5-phosphate 3-epimerase [Abditibacteriota bacterium]|nr:L-ribulose-5-phosphate 3-epimerase [Abditibacteriota bacterium]